MLASFELHLRPRANIPLDRHVGRWINGLFYDLVGRGDPALAAQIHEGSAARPFTCSVLHGRRHRVDGRPVAVPGARPSSSRNGTCSTWPARGHGSGCW
jgi:CRISPR/Cas system endoribonuclease Cas6 (RAMP superfamily)